MAQVIIYSTPTCPSCIMAKHFLKSNNIKFIDKDISLDKEALDEMMKKSDQAGIPVIDIDGKIVVGFDRNRLKKALGLD